MERQGRGGGEDEDQGEGMFHVKHIGKVGRWEGLMGCFAQICARFTLKKR